MEGFPFEWVTQADQRGDDEPASIFPTFRKEHIFNHNLVPLNSPARLENHKDDFLTLMEATYKARYSIHHASTKTQLSLNTKRHFHNDVLKYERILRTDASTAYAVRSASYSSFVRKLQTPSAAKKALENWRQKNSGGLPDQLMTFSTPAAVKIRGKTQFRISCQLSMSYPNFHILCIYQYVDHTETMYEEPAKEIRLASVMLQTKENTWWIALEQQGSSDGFLEQVIGSFDYTRLGGIPISDAAQGYRGDITSPEGHLLMDFQKKITVPAKYDLGRLWCEAVGFYQVDVYIPELPDPAGAST